MNSLWTLFGIANQLFAATVLAIGSCWIMENSAKKKYALITALPCLLLLATASTAGLISIGRWSAEMNNIPANEISKIILQIILIGMAAILLISTFYITCRSFLRPFRTR